MRDNPSHLTETPDGVLLRVHVQPRASKNEVIGWTEEGLKVRLTSPPVDGAANRLCTDFMAGVFGVSRSSVTLQSGEKSRKKVLRVQGITGPQAEELIARSLQTHR